MQKYRLRVDFDNDDTGLILLNQCENLTRSFKCTEYSIEWIENEDGGYLVLSTNDPSDAFICLFSIPESYVI